MSIIQIRTTNTCSSAPKWLEKTYMFPWGACLGPMERMGMNSTVSLSWLGHKHCESRYLNLCKSKTHQEIMKLRMVSLHGTYICPIWAKLYYMALTNRSFSHPRGSDKETCPLVGQMIITPSSSLVFSSTRDTEQLEIRAKLCNYAGCV